MENTPLLLTTENLEENDESPESDENGPSIARRWTYEEAVEFIGLGRFHVILVLICGWANSSDSVEVMCLALILSNVQCDLEISSSQLGILTCMIFAGMMIGGYIWGSLGDLWGRRNVLICCLFVNGAFAFASAFAQSYLVFILLRFLCGVG